MFFYILVLTVHNLEHMLKYIFVLYLFLQNYVSNSIFTPVLCIIKVNIIFDLTPFSFFQTNTKINFYPSP